MAPMPNRLEFSANLVVTLLLTYAVGAAIAQTVAPPHRPVPPARDPHTEGYVASTDLPDDTNPSPKLDGNFIVGPTHSPAPEAAPQPTVPQGTVSEFTMS